MLTTLSGGWRSPLFSSLEGYKQGDNQYLTCELNLIRFVSALTVETMSKRKNRKIAIAVDLSDESAYAVQWAVANYLKPDDFVVLLHVQPTRGLYGADWGAMEQAVDSKDEESKQRLEKSFDILTMDKTKDLAKPIVDAGNSLKIHIVKDHDMKERICLEVERLGVNAVIMGSRGFGAAKKAEKSRLGSVSDYCLHHCDCPVVLVRYPDDENEQPHKFFRESVEEGSKMEVESTPQDSMMHTGWTE